MIAQCVCVMMRMGEEKYEDSRESETVQAAVNQLNCQTVRHGAKINKHETSRCHFLSANVAIADRWNVEVWTLGMLAAQHKEVEPCVLVLQGR